MHHPDPTTHKPNLRRFAKTFRKQLAASAISEQICDRLLTWPQYQEARTILAFRALPQEIDLAALYDSPFKTWLLPRVEGGKQDARLRFFHYKNGDPLEKSAFQVEEPLGTATPLEAGGNVDLILLPGLMFDQNGNRLGYGLSFYDRFIKEFFPGKKPLLAGVVADALLVPKLPSDAWDIPVDWVITEAGIYETGKG